MTTAPDAVLACFEAHPGKSLRVKEVKTWIAEHYETKWKHLGTTLADLVLDGNKSTKYPLERRFLERVKPGVYRHIDSHPVGRGPTRGWSVDLWLANFKAAHGPHAEVVFGDVREALHASGFDLRPSTRREGNRRTLWPFPSAEPTYDWCQPVCFREDGQVEVPFQYMSVAPFREPDVRAQLVDLLNKIAGVSIDQTQGRPTFDIACLDTREAIAHLVETVRWSASLQGIETTGRSSDTTDQPPDSPTSPGPQGIEKTSRSWGTTNQPPGWPTPEAKVNSSDVYTRDPAKMARALRAHAETQLSLKKFLERSGVEPVFPERAKSPDPMDPEYDLAWYHPSGTFNVAEVKSMTDLNEVGQLRLGLGQVLHYKGTLESEGQDRKVRAHLVVEREPGNVDLWRRICQAAGVTLSWADEMEHVLADEDVE